MARIRPIEDRIVLQLINEERVSAGGIHLMPVQKHEHPDKKGTVLAIGPGLKNSTGGRNEMSVAVGDVVCFGGMAGLEVPWDDLTDAMVITEEDVLYIIEEG